MTRIALAKSPARRLLIAATAAAAGAAFAMSGSVSAGSAGYPVVRPSAQDSVQVATGNDGHGRTIAIIDSFGYDTVASDLENFSKQFGLPLMCGMPGVTCAPGMPTFEWDQWDGKRPVKQPPSGSHGTNQQAGNAWAEEVALDTRWAHATAPGANIILMSTASPRPRAYRDCRR